ncbi:MAG: signal recognition particle subunit SRP19/SEC65 family protein [Nitrososphaerota archaeon]|nr:signal recognition particle subunit SRP19/SEC65 family protein [Nitrososphaerota archaeon]
MKKLSKDRYVIIYPQYFDSKLSRKMGRRVPKSIAIISPSLTRIKEACDKLGLKTIIEYEKTYPRISNVKSGRIIVFCNYLGKRKLIQELSKLLKGVG